jgi:hypothetical protein
MSRARWQHLDLSRPAASAPPAPASGAPDPAPGAGAPPESAPLQAARGYYHLRQFQACADILTEALAGGLHVPGARRLLGLALGQVGDYPAAAASLALAVEEDPTDTALSASLLSARLAAGEAPDVAGFAGVPSELTAAAAWRRAQRALSEGYAGEAARGFGDAARLFGESPADVLGERRAACYVGHAVSYLLAGEPEAAQQGYTRIMGRTRASESAVAFARRVYEVGEALRGLPSAERESALAPLVELLLSARLVVGFYDGVRPAALHWEGLG